MSHGEFAGALDEGEYFLFLSNFKCFCALHARGGNIAEELSSVSRSGSYTALALLFSGPLCTKRFKTKKGTSQGVPMDDYSIYLSLKV